MENTSKPILVAGAGGFIGGHLIGALLKQGFTQIRAVDVKPISQWHQHFPSTESLQMDLADKSSCHRAVSDISEVYNLAADMGGMGFIEANKTACMLSVLINTHLLMAAREHAVDRFFYASSACVYAAQKQRSANAKPLKEADAYPAMPEDGYGWEKLFSERMCRHYFEEFGIATRVARYHNVYGPFGTYDQGREKAPAAICRKIIEAKLSGRQTIEIWGDGEQTRSFLFVDDCISGTQRLMASDCTDPINIGSARLISINQLVDVVETIAGSRLKKVYLRHAPQGVRGRSSDNTMVHERLGWVPEISLEQGLEKTYQWIYDQMVSVHGYQRGNHRQSPPDSVSTR